MQNLQIHPDRRQILTTALGVVAMPLAFAQSSVDIDETWQDQRRQRAVPVRIR